MSPQVRDLQGLITEQRAALAPQYGLIDESIAQNATAGEAQVAGLDATRKKTFGNIEQAAQDKGMFFSGFSPDAQAEYTASTYLPAVAQLQATIAQTRSQLLGKKAELDKGAFDTAFNAREGDLKVLADWNQMTAQQQFQASQADKDRVFQAQEAEKNRQSDARIAAANRAASAPKDISGVVRGIGEFLSKSVGKDGRVSPTTFQQGKQQWVAAGGDPDTYNQTYAAYINQDHYWDYLGKK